LEIRVEIFYNINFKGVQALEKTNKEDKPLKAKDFMEILRGIAVLQKSRDIDRTDMFYQPQNDFTKKSWESRPMKKESY